ncbi:MAG: hypothetical protein IKQ62_08180 [Bacteroidaceae bacterium]|nr:hypothetical protein [Bacteroidaceae bacterium]
MSKALPFVSNNMRCAPIWATQATTSPNTHLKASILTCEGIALSKSTIFMTHLLPDHSQVGYRDTLTTHAVWFIKPYIDKGCPRKVVDVNNNTMMMLPVTSDRSIDYHPFPYIYTGCTLDAHAAPPFFSWSDGQMSISDNPVTSHTFLRTIALGALKPDTQNRTRASLTPVASDSMVRNCCMGVGISCMKSSNRPDATTLPSLSDIGQSNDSGKPVTFAMASRFNLGGTE